MNDNTVFVSPTVRLARRVLFISSVALNVMGWTATGVHHARAGESAIAGTLQWTNGDRLPGQLLGSTASHVRWQAPIFATPLSVDLQYVDSVRFPEAAPATVAGEPIRFVTDSDDVLDGRLIDLTERHVVLQSRRLGTVRLVRTAVRRFFRRPQLGPATTTGTDGADGFRARQRDEREPLGIGPNGKLSWKTLTPTQPVLKWQTNAAGELTTSTFNAEAFRDLKLPPVAEVDMVLRWRNRPRFRISFAKPDAVKLSRQTVRLETWDDELTLRVLANNGQFKQLHTLPKPLKSIRLRLMWSQRTGKLSVFLHDFEFLGSMRSRDGNAAGHTGLYIQNLGTDLTLSALRVGNWHGAEPPEVSENTSHIVLANGQTVFGQIQAYESASRSLVVTERSGGRRRITIAQVAQVELGERPAPRANRPLELSYHDGVVLRGALQSIDGSAVWLKTAYCEQPIRCQLAGANAIKIVKAGSAPDDRADAVLECEETKLRGTLVPPVSGDSFGWKLVGGTSVVPLSRDRPAHIVRNATATHEVSATTELPDVLHLRNGDAVPCRIQTIDDTYLYLRTDVAQAARIGLDRVKAVHLHSEGHLPTYGFGGRGWRVSQQQEDAVERMADRVIFRGPATLGHGDLLQADEIQFDLQWNDHVGALMMIRLFASDVGRRADPSFLVYYMGRQMYVQARQPQVQGALRRNMLTNGRATVRLSLSHELCRVFVNQKEVLSQPIRPQDQAGRGIVLSVQRLNIRPQPNAAGQRVPPQRAELLTVSNLQVGKNRVRFGALRIDELKKELLLTVPRSEKKNPPTHMLVAQNGDLLRGQLSQLGEQSARFTSRGNEFVFPRQRLAGIVWLEEFENRSPPSPPDNRSLQARLASGSTLTLTARPMSGDDIVGQHAILGDCRVPFRAVRELYIGNHPAPVRQAPYADWVLRPAKEPVFANMATDSNLSAGDMYTEQLGLDSPLVGTTPEDFRAELLDGQVFRLRDHWDKIIILDFWASWCGPCVQELPGTIEATSSIPPDKVMLVAINQLENAATIREFLQPRDWNLTVALDPDGIIGRQFQVEAIPQTVIIGPGGKVERVLVGANRETREALKRALYQLVTSRVSSDVPTSD